ncbi:hypothetical protein N9O56_00195 [Rickettsiales bacterium]|nr:hypothetical protein [Rickettsiales bacterium]
MSGKVGPEFKHGAQVRAPQKEIDVTSDSGRNNDEFQKIIQQMREAQKARASSADDVAKKGKEIADVIFKLLNDPTLNSGVFLKYLTLRFKNTNYDIKNIYEAVLIALKDQIEQDRKKNDRQLTNVDHDELIAIINEGLGLTPVSAASIGEARGEKGGFISNSEIFNEINPYQTCPDLNKLYNLPIKTPYTEQDFEKGARYDLHNMEILRKKLTNKIQEYRTSHADERLSPENILNKFIQKANQDFHVIISKDMTIESFSSNELQYLITAGDKEINPEQAANITIISALGLDNHTTYRSQEVEKNGTKIEIDVVMMADDNCCARIPVRDQSGSWMPYDYKEGSFLSVELDSDYNAIIIKVKNGKTTTLSPDEVEGLSEIQQQCLFRGISNARLIKTDGTELTKSAKELLAGTLLIRARQVENNNEAMGNMASLLANCAAADPAQILKREQERDNPEETSATWRKKNLTISTKIWNFCKGGWNWVDEEPKDGWTPRIGRGFSKAFLVLGEILAKTTAITAGFALDCTATPAYRKYEQLSEDDKFKDYFKNYFPLVNWAIDGFSNSPTSIKKVGYFAASVIGFAGDLVMNVAIKPTLGNAILTAGQLLGAFNPMPTWKDAKKAFPENNYVAVAVLPFLYAKNVIQGIGRTAWGALSRLPIANGINTDSDYTKGGFRGFGNKFLSFLKRKPMEQQEINLNAECSKISKELGVSPTRAKGQSRGFLSFLGVVDRLMTTDSNVLLKVNSAQAEAGQKIMELIDKTEEPTIHIDDDMIEPLILKHLQLLKDGNNPQYLEKTTKLLNASGICGNALKEKVTKLTPFIDRNMWSCTKEQIREFSSIYDKADQIGRLLGENSDLSTLSDLLSNEVLAK